MQYKGKLYGKVGTTIFPLEHTTDDWQKMETRIAQLEAENRALRQPIVVEQREHLNAFMDYCNKVEPVWAAEFRAWIGDYLEGA